jgi:hypothetical protein
MSRGHRTIFRFALAGILVPGVTWLLVTAADSYGPSWLTGVAAWLFTVSCPFWILSWYMTVSPDSDLLFLSLLCATLLLNVLLYGTVGALYVLARDRYFSRSTVQFANERAANMSPNKSLERTRDK